MSQGGEVPPHRFPEVPPSGDLTGHRSSIAYSLGELTTEMRHFGDRLEKFETRIDGALKDHGKDIQDIKDRILVAQTTVSSTFYASKWLLLALGAVLGWIIANWSWFLRHLQ